MTTQTLLAIALFAALLSAALYWVFVRPVPTRTAAGVIVDKTFEDERSITRVKAGPRREVWSASRLRIPAGYLFTVRLAGGRGDVYCMMEKVAAEPFQPGQSVTVTYDERGVPGLCMKRYVRSITPASE